MYTPSRGPRIDPLPTIILRLANDRTVGQMGPNLLARLLLRLFLLDALSRSFFLEYNRDACKISVSGELPHLRLRVTYWCTASLTYQFFPLPCDSTPFQMYPSQPTPPPHTSLPASFLSSPLPPTLPSSDGS